MKWGYHMKNNKAVYKMIDFSNSDGTLYLCIHYPNNNSSRLRFQLMLRQNRQTKIDIPIKVYGNYIEISLSVEEIFKDYIIKSEEVWDFYLYNDTEEIEISLDNFTSFMTDYYPMKERIYIVKPYVTGLNKIALFIKSDTFTFNLESFEQQGDITNLDISIQGKYIKNMDDVIKHGRLYFKKRLKKIGDNEYEYPDKTLTNIEFKAIVNNIISTRCSFEECLKYETLPQKKNPLDGYIVLKDFKKEEIELPLIVETSWNNKPYVKIDKNIKACWFKNYQNALGICTNKR